MASDYKNTVFQLLLLNYLFFKSYWHLPKWLWKEALKKVSNKWKTSWSGCNELFQSLLLLNNVRKISETFTVIFAFLKSPILSICSLSFSLPAILPLLSSVPASSLWDVPTHNRPQDCAYWDKGEFNIYSMAESSDLIPQPNNSPCCSVRVWGDMLLPDSWASGYMVWLALLGCTGSQV